MKCFRLLQSEDVKQLGDQLAATSSCLVTTTINYTPDTVLGVVEDHYLYLYLSIYLYIYIYITK